MVTMKDYLSPKLDIVFKMIFGDERKELLLNKFHNAFGEIREDDSLFLQTLFN
jgi:hypothetical protein